MFCGTETKYQLALSPGQIQSFAVKVIFCGDVFMGKVYDTLYEREKVFYCVL